MPPYDPPSVQVIVDNRLQCIDMMLWAKAPFEASCAFCHRTPSALSDEGLGLSKTLRFFVDSESPRSARAWRARGPDGKRPSHLQ